MSQLLSVSLPPAAWNTVIQLVTRGAYGDVKPIIDSIVAQLSPPKPATAAAPRRRAPASAPEPTPAERETADNQPT